MSGDDDVVADLERFVDGDHESRGEVAERLLEGEAEDEARHAESGDNGRDVHAELAEDEHEQDRPAHLRRRVADEVREQRVLLPSLRDGLADGGDDQPRREPAEKQDRQRAEEVEGQGDALVGQPVDCLLDDVRLMAEAVFEFGADSRADGDAGSRKLVCHVRSSLQGISIGKMCGDYSTF